MTYCKDCRFLEFSDCYGECGKGYFGVVSPTDYCSRGERRENGNGKPDGEHTGDCGGSVCDRHDREGVE